MKFNIIHFDEIDSTNQYLLKNATTLDDFSVAVAAKQTAGRGRKGRSWYSPQGGNLYFSLLIKTPQVEFHELSSIPQLMALAICESLQKSGIKNSWIKWPNDVYINHKKVCGILCESRLKGPILEGLIIGVGLNINMSLSEAQQIDMPATSMLIESHDQEPFKIAETLHVILQAFKKHFLSWLDKSNRAQIVELWRENSQLIGKAVCLSDNTTKIYGTVVDFTENGEIMLQTERGINNYSYGDLSLRVQ
jgi:BirA family transcriptional regulator, biotin operon repressor / biotin---[acetyl-CoA-carboxylase] ligase